MIFLGNENIGVKRWSATLVIGFIGVFLVMDPEDR